MLWRVAALRRFGWQASDGMGGRLRRFTQDGAQGQRLLAGVGPDGDAVMDGCANQLVERFGGLEVEVLVLRVADEESAPFEPPGDASADGVQQPDATAKSLFERLRSLHPNRFTAGQLRTLQRRVREWRVVMAQQLVYGGLDDAEPWAISPMGAAGTSPDVVSPGVVEKPSSILGG